jgi:voltage-gated potassium channel
MAQVKKYKPATPEPSAPWRERLHEIIFESDTPAGKVFDVGLLILIVLSFVVISLDSVAALRAQYGETLRVIEWYFTIVFTIEYVLRLIAVRRPLRYARSFFGIVDLLSIIPTYLSIFVTGAQALQVVRVLRLLRLFRILELSHYLNEANVLITALRASRVKITVFLGTVLTITVIVGALMYVVEGPANGFDNIPRSMYWAIVTLTTVGYGDIAPQTVLGQLIASVLMILGYGIIAVPTGIVSVEIARATTSVNIEACPACGAQGHDLDARFCKYCGESLE